MRGYACDVTDSGLVCGLLQWPSNDELCAFCSGFGSVRCEVCGSRGVLTILGTSVQRQCPACEGRKRERCRRCAGSGKSGMKKSVIVDR